MTAPPPTHDERKALGVDADKARQDEHAARAEGWIEEGEDVVRLNITKDVRWMRQGAFGIAIAFLLGLPVYLPWQIHTYLSWFSCGGAITDKMVEALTTPITALIAGTYFSITAIFLALLRGVFSDSRKKNSASNIPLVANAIQKMTGNGG